MILIKYIYINYELQSSNIIFYLLTGIVRMNSFSTNGAVHYETLSVSTPAPFVFHVELNRPDKLNAMNRTMWL